jgi:uncharacterized protein
MNTNLRPVINLFNNQKVLAIAGVSRKSAKFGHAVYAAALKNGYTVIPINPKGGVIDGISCIESVSALDNHVENLLVVTNKRDTEKVVREAIAKGIKNIWIQNGCETTEAIELAKSGNVNLVSKKCFLMYTSPKGIHKFHQTLSRWIGAYEN